MANAKGLLVTPVGFRTDGIPHAFELDNSDRLKILIEPHSVFGLSGITQVVKNGLKDNGFLSLYTVTAAKTLWITSIYLTIVNLSAVAANCYMHIRNASAVVQFSWQIASVAGITNSMSVSLVIPVQVIAGWDVALQSDTALAYALGTFSGYEL